MRVRRMAAVGTGIAVLVAVGGLAMPSLAADAPVTSECPKGDARTTPAQRLPRPGVVGHVPVGPWTLYVLTSVFDDRLGLIALAGRGLGDPMVSVWQTATDCDGLDVSRGTWGATPDGQVLVQTFSAGAPAAFFGDMRGKRLNQPIVGMSPTADGQGYWLVASDGGIFAFGDAQFYGSTGALTLNRPIVGMATTPTGRGYYLVASDGGIFAFGDAQFYGSTGAIKLNKPISGMTSTTSGRGYWMTATDGGIFAYGDAEFRGSTGNQVLTAPIAGMIANGAGYTLIGEDAKLYPFK